MLPVDTRHLDESTDLITSPSPSHSEPVTGGGEGDLPGLNRLGSPRLYATRHLKKLVSSGGPSGEPP